MQTDKPFGCRLGGLGFGVFIVGVDQFELGLIGIASERVARLQSLQFGGSTGIAVVIQVGLRLLVQLDFAQVVVNNFLCRRTSGGQCEDGDQQQVSHLHGGLRPYDGRCLGRVRPVMMNAP